MSVEQSKSWKKFYLAGEIAHLVGHAAELYREKSNQQDKVNDLSFFYGKGQIIEGLSHGSDKSYAF